MFAQPAVTPPKPSNERRLIIISSIILVVALAIVVAFNLRPNHSSKIKSISKKGTPIVQPMFTFTATKAPDWHAGPSDATSIVAFYNKADCFIELDQHPGSIDDTAENAKAVATMQSQGSSNVSTTNVPLTLAASNGAIPYTLHQYRAVGGQSEYYQYEEAAYIPQQQNYLAISGYCKNGSDLNATLDALQAVSLSHG